MTRTCWHFLCIASLFSIVACIACGAPPDVLESAPVIDSSSIHVAPMDDKLAASLDRAIAWWLDAGPLPRDVTVEPAGTLDAWPLAWSPETSPDATGAVVGGRFVGDAIHVSAECSTWPAPYLDTVVAHELGHAMGLGHVQGDPHELMAPSPEVPGEVCITRETVACREVR